jgi:hypothetical protein
MFPRSSEAQVAQHRRDHQNAIESCTSHICRLKHPSPPRRWSPENFRPTPKGNEHGPQIFPYGKTCRPPPTLLTFVTNLIQLQKQLKWLVTDKQLLSSIAPETEPE